MRFSIFLVFFIFTFGAAQSQNLGGETPVDSLKIVEKAMVKNDSSGRFLKTTAKVFGIMPYDTKEKPRVALWRSLLVPSWGQITNRDYWKVPMVLGAAGAGWYFGIRQNNLRYHRYLGHYKVATYVGRGQAYIYPADGNLENLSKLSTASTFYLKDDNTNTSLFVKSDDGTLYRMEGRAAGLDGQELDHFLAHEVTEDANSIIGPYNLQTFKSAKDQYRRWRDASFIGIAAGWLFFALEANVSAHLKNFDVSDDISMKISPAGPATFGTRANGISLSFAFK